MNLNKWFGQIAETVSHAAGHAVAFIICCIVVIVWAASGPAFGFSDTWQLVINTGTTIVTFLMVFLIQNTQNRDSAAIQAKLDELILVTAAENSFIGIEHLTEEEVNEFRKKCKTAAERAKSRTFYRQKDSCQSEKGRVQGRVAFSLTSSTPGCMSTEQQIKHKGQARRLLTQNRTRAAEGYSTCFSLTAARRGLVATRSFAQAADGAVL